MGRRTGGKPVRGRLSGRWKGPGDLRPDVYKRQVFCPLAMVDKAVFEQEGWHRDADGTVSGVVYNEMQGALASPDAQLSG